MPKLRGPDFLSLHVRNVSISRAFYTERLGFTVDPRFDAPDFVLFDTNSIPLGITQARVDLDTLPQPGLGVTLWIDCDHVDALYENLRGDGATVVTPPFDSPFGRAMIIQDPDGYRFTVNENPWDRFPLGGSLTR